MDDAHDYLATRKAMDVVGISKEEQVICIIRVFVVPYALFLAVINIMFLFDRTQSSELLHLFSISVMLSLPREKRLIHRFSRMTKQSFIFRLQQSFSCMTGDTYVVSVLFLSHDCNTLYGYQVRLQSSGRCIAEACDGHSRRSY